VDKALWHGPGRAREDRGGCRAPWASDRAGPARVGPRRDRGLAVLGIGARAHARVRAPTRDPGLCPHLRGLDPDLCRPQGFGPDLLCLALALGPWAVPHFRGLGLGALALDRGPGAGSLVRGRLQSVRAPLLLPQA
jgi:hypothetical protein